MVCNVLLKHAWEPGDCMTPSMTPVSKQVCRKSWGSNISTGKFSRNVMHLGWLSRKSSLSNLLEFFEGVQKHEEKVDLADTVHLNFQKVSNTFPNQKLLKKLSSHSMKAKNSYIFLTCSWLKQGLGIYGHLLWWIGIGIISEVLQGLVLEPCA